MKTVMMTEEMSKLSESPPMSLFCSLPEDVVLNILARISRMHHPSLSLVSKRFRSVLASRELDAIRTLIGITEKHIYCLMLLRTCKSFWFEVSPFSKQKPVPLPPFPYPHPGSPTIVVVGSEIHLIGGYINGKRSRRVFVLDCRSHQWRELPEMHVPRGDSSAAGVIGGKVYVFGDCNIGETWGEIYDPKTQTWEPFSPTTLTPHLSIQKEMATDSSRMKFFPTSFWFVAQERILCKLSRDFGRNSLHWYDFENKMTWRQVKGLEGLLDKADVISVANPDGGRRLAVWWVSYQKDEDRVLVKKVEIRCAVISFQRRSRKELYGIVEWSKILRTMDRSETGGLVTLFHSAIVMY